jgi:acetyltransferase-like isoleucine patch superfamily enzyme
MADEATLQVKEFGRGNKIISAGPDPASLPVEFTDRARDCTIRIGRGSSVGGKIRMRGPNAQVILGDRVQLTSVSLFVGADSLIQIGTRVWVGPGSEMSAAEGASVLIGGQSLVGANAIIRADDSHPFYDRATGARLNRARTVTLEEHVWLGRDVAVLPGAVVRSGCVVGTRSTVTKSSGMPPNSVVVGNPLRVVRTDVEWLYKHVQLDSDVPDSIEPTVLEQVPLERRDGRKRSLGGLVPRLARRRLNASV